MDSFDAERAAWAIVVAYALCFGLVIFAWRGSARGSAGARETWFWALVGLGIFLLGVNKQLDLQTQFTAFLREVARDGGWFDMRREAQALFVRGLLLAMAIGALALAWLTRGLGAPVRVALLGVLLLGSFVALRAASFHHVDVLLRTTLFGTRAWVVLELAGIAVVAAGAGWALLRQRRGSA